MGVKSHTVPSVRKRSAMLFRRGRTMLVLVAVFWLWMLLGSANFIAALFNAPFYALLALYGLGVLTLISLVVAGVSVFFMISNRPERINDSAGDSARPGFTDLAPVIRMVPRRIADHSAALTTKAAAKWRDLAS